MSTNEMFLLSQDGPMGFNHVFFIQVLLGCAAAHPEAKGSAEILESMKRVGQCVQDGDSSSCSTQQDGEHSKPWADFVQTIIDGGVDDQVAKSFFTDAQVIKNISGPVEYDYRLNQQAMQASLQANNRVISRRFGQAMRLIAPNEDGKDDDDDEGEEEEDGDGEEEE